MFIIFCAKLECIFINNCVKIVLSACMFTLCIFILFGSSKLEVTIQLMSVRFDGLCVVMYNCGILGCNGM